MRAAGLRNVDASTRSGLSSGTCDTKHVKDKGRNEGITREPRKRKRGKPRLRDHWCSCPGPSDPSVDTHSLSCNTITSLPPPPRHRPRCSVEFRQDVSGIGEVGAGFPGSIMIGVSNPLDEVLGGIATAAGVKDAFHFILHMVINRDRERRRDRCAGGILYSVNLCIA